jgi:hypothetical protein
MGYDVSIPLTESAAYDLVVDDGDQLARVQRKFAIVVTRSICEGFTRTLLDTS